MSKGFSIIVAATSNLGIGKNNQLPWRLNGDMQTFKRITSVSPSNDCINVVIMGRKTYESIPLKFRPLSNRINIILSRNPDVHDIFNINIDDNKNDPCKRVLIASSLEQALSYTTNKSLIPNPGHIFVIGGGMLYKEAIESKLCQKIYMTEILSLNEDFKDLDTFFPVISAMKYVLVSKSKQIVENDLIYRYLEFNQVDDDMSLSHKINDDKLGIKDSNEEEKRDLVNTNKIHESHEENNEEKQYLNMIQEITHSGVLRGDRTGTGTYSIFGVQMRFSLRNGITSMTSGLLSLFILILLILILGQFPLLTTKKVFWRGVVEELLWFIKGSTNSNILKEKGIGIWDGNGSREFLDKIGLTHREGIDIYDITL